MQLKHLFKSLNGLILAGVFLGGSLALTPLAHSSDSAKAHSAPIGVGIIDAYIAVQTALAADSMQNIAMHAAKLDEAGVPSAREMAAATEIAFVRQHLETVSNHLIKRIQQAGAVGGTFRIAYCPMAFDGSGAYWLQAEEGSLANPYFGSMMLRCGSFEETIAATEAPTQSEHQH